MDSISPRPRLTASRGTILVLALVFMLMMAIVAVMVLQTAVLQLHMAGNDQFLEEAFHKVQAIATQLSLNPNNFSLDGGVGHTNCPSVPSQDCDSHVLQVPAAAVVPAGVELDYRITRQDPLLWRGFPLRESQGTVSSSSSFNAVPFEISVRINGSEKRLGSAHIVQGIAVRVPALH